MKKFIFIMLVFILGSVTVNAQKPGAKTAFRANKDQLIMAQKILKVEPTGKPNAATKTAITAFQREKSLKETGVLDRETMQKLGIGLTTAQREISTDVVPDEKKTALGDSPKPPTTSFRATKDQIIRVQKLLKAGGFYSGEATGIVNAATGEGLKKYQAENDLEATGAINQITLEKMDIPVTEKQREESKAGSE